MKVRIATIKALLLVLLFAMPLSMLASKGKEVKIVFTTDVHGAIFPYDFIEQKARPGSLAQVSSSVK